MQTVKTGDGGRAIPPIYETVEEYVRLSPPPRRRVREQLLGLGYPEVGLVDGLMGPKSQAAIRAFAALRDAAGGGAATFSAAQRLLLTIVSAVQWASCSPSSPGCGRS